MPKKRPRESSEDIIERYQRKIRRIEERQRKKHRRVRFISSSDSEETTPVIVTPTTPLPPPTPPSAEEIPAQTNSMAMPVEVIGSDDVISPPCPPTPEDPNCPATDPELDPDLLLALGEEISNIPNFGVKIHHSLAQRWDPILKKGLPKEAKDKLFKDYLVPENCTLLQAPRLNNEVAAAISEAARHRDKRKEIDQQQLGVGISAINKALTLMLTGDDKLEAIRVLSDGCRILTDLHNQQTQARINVINYALAKPFLNVVQDSERDDTLYGNKLGEKIKASKAIEKQGLSIKKFTKVPKTTPSLEQAGTSTRPYQYPAQPAVASYQGNWSGPPRLRGGAEGAQEDERSTEPTTSSSSAECGSPEQAPGGCVATLAQESTYPGCRNTLRQAFSHRDVPESAMNLVLASLSNNTIAQYNVSFKLWWQYCRDNNHNTFNCSVPIVLCFLSEQYNKGVSYGSLNSHRSALSLLLGSNIGSDDRVKRLLKGVFKLKPSFPKYSYTWDPQIVLNNISSWVPNRELSREKITKKLVILLALCTAQRVQTLSLIKLENISISSGGINIAIKDIGSAAGRLQPELYLPYFRENPSICPATTLEDYLHVTSGDRPANVSNLLLTVKRPFRSATAQSISRWIKQVLSDSGVDMAAFSAHSTRHAATSAAASAGVSIDTIRKTAGWTNTSKVFAQFYCRPLLQNNEFANSVLHHQDSDDSHS